METQNVCADKLCVVCMHDMTEPAFDPDYQHMFNEIAENTVRLRCGHAFHSSCIALWWNHNKTVECLYKCEDEWIVLRDMQREVRQAAVANRNDARRMGNEENGNVQNDAEMDDRQRQEISRLMTFAKLMYLALFLITLTITQFGGQKENSNKFWLTFVSSSLLWLKEDVPFTVLLICCCILWNTFALQVTSFMFLLFRFSILMSMILVGAATFLYILFRLMLSPHKFILRRAAANDNEQHANG